MSESPPEGAHSEPAFRNCDSSPTYGGFYARRHPRFETLTDTLRSGRGRDFWTRLDPEFANSLGKTTIWTHPDLAGRPRMRFVISRSAVRVRSPAPLEAITYRDRDSERSGTVSPPCHRQPEGGSVDTGPAAALPRPASRLPSRHALTRPGTNVSGRYPGNLHKLGGAGSVVRRLRTAPCSARKVGRLRRLAAPGAAGCSPSLAVEGAPRRQLPRPGAGRPQAASDIDSLSVRHVQSPVRASACPAVGWS